VAATGPTARVRGRLLLRGQSIAPALFVPLLHAVACQIESLAARDFLHDAGKLGRGLEALHDAVRSDALVCCCSAGIEAEAAGAQLSWDAYPPRVVSAPEGEVAISEMSRSPRLAAALEATRRLSATARGEPLLVAALTGPATLAAQLGGDDSARSIERAGAIGVDLAGQFCRAGASLIVLLEESVPGSEKSLALWRSTLSPILKVARFHQALAVVVSATPSFQATLGLGDERDRATPVVALPETTAEWPIERPQASLITTAREVPSSTPVAELRAACHRFHG
jgi:acetophenone carboxylase